jgi:general secretion pathway protein G
MKARIDHMKEIRRDNKAGFTLLEILLVVTIIGMLLAVAVVKIAPRAEEARKVTTRQQIQNYGAGLNLYMLDSGFYPSAEQGLQALITQPATPPVPSNWKGPYLEPAVLRKDQWGHDYIYKYPGTHNPTTYDLYSPGPNGVEGDEDDIGNWQ